MMERKQQTLRLAGMCVLHQCRLSIVDCPGPRGDRRVVSCTPEHSPRRPRGGFPMLAECLLRRGRAAMAHVQRTLRGHLPSGTGRPLGGRLFRHGGRCLRRRSSPSHCSAGGRDVAGLWNRLRSVCPSFLSFFSSTYEFYIFRTFFSYQCTIINLNYKIHYLFFFLYFQPFQNEDCSRAVIRLQEAINS